MDVKFDPTRAGYDQPNDPPAYSGPPAGQPYSGPPAGQPYSGPPAGQPYSGPPAGQPYVYPNYPPPQQTGYPAVQSTTNVVVTQPTTTAIIVPRQRETDWTLPAVLATLFCFCPTGICAIIAAVHARSAHDSGDYDGERSATKWAKGLTITSIAIGIIAVVLSVILYITLVAVVTNEEHDLYTG